MSQPEVTPEAMPLYECVLNMTLAAYLNPRPDKQIRRMAKKYRKKFPTSNVAAHNTFDILIKASNPAKIVRVAYDEMVK